MTLQLEKAEEIRHHQREEWSAAAPGWAEYRESLSSTASSITQKLLEMAGVGPGQRVLDLACGVGDPAFSIAKAVGDSGSVLGLDITEKMLEAARAGAAKNALKNIEFRLIPSELELGVDEASFDAATCRHGLMYTPNPVATLETLRKALKPGGRLAVSTWGAPERGPFFGVPVQVILRHVTLPPPDPSTPGPFAISSQEALAAIFKAAGFSQVRSVAFETPANQAESPAAYWDLVCATAGPLVALLASLPAETCQAIREDAIQTLQTMFPTGPVVLGAECLVASGLKA